MEKMTYTQTSQFCELYLISGADSCGKGGHFFLLQAMTLHALYGEDTLSSLHLAQTRY